LLATATAAKFAQICPKLPKSAQRQLVHETLKFHQNLRFWFFPKKRTSMCRKKGYQSMCIPFGFSFQEFLLCLFYCLKTAAVCEFQHTPLCKMILLSRFHMSCVYEDFVDMCLTNIGTRIWSPLIHIYSKKWFFCKHCCTP
jgi:hypothetical protein